MLDENSVIPLYYQLKEILKEKIKEGSWKEGYKVPSERDLMDMYQVSRATARKALSELMIEGLIVKKQGVGTFVSKSKVLQDLTGELSFAHQVKKQGLVPSLKLINAGVEKETSPRIKNIFTPKDSSEIFRLSGVLFADDEPLILETDYVPISKAPNILEKDLERTVFFEYLKNECNIHFTHSTLEVEPTLINDFEASHLSTDVGKPALLVERIIYSDEIAVVFQKRIILGERCKYFFTLGPNPNENSDYTFRLKIDKNKE
jgi:GntR family transcriptional regulator